MKNLIIATLAIATLSGCQSITQNINGETVTTNLAEHYMTTVDDFTGVTRHFVSGTFRVGCSNFSSKGALNEFYPEITISTSGVAMAPMVDMELEFKTPDRQVIRATGQSTDYDEFRFFGGDVEEIISTIINGSEDDQYLYRMASDYKMLTNGKVKFNGWTTGTVEHIDNVITNVCGLTIK